MQYVILVYPEWTTSQASQAHSLQPALDYLISQGVLGDNARPHRILTHAMSNGESSSILFLAYLNMSNRRLHSIGSSGYITSKVSQTWYLTIDNLGYDCRIRSWWGRPKIRFCRIRAHNAFPFSQISSSDHRRLCTKHFLSL